MEAVFIDAPLERLENALNDFAASVKQPLQLAAENKLAAKDGTAEGEGNSRQPFAQRMVRSALPIIGDLIYPRHQSGADVVFNSGCSLRRFHIRSHRHGTRIVCD